MITNSDKFINSRDVIKRITDLEDQLVDRWVAGWNMPGYLPDSDPAEFDDFDDAKEYIADEIDLLAEDPLLTDQTAMGLSSTADEIRKLEEGEFGQTIGDYHYFITQDGQMGLDEDDLQELNALKALQDEAEGYCDWRHGATLIHEDYFTEYVQQFAEDIGAVGKDADNWLVIDWEKTADNLKMGYTSVDFDGETYWVRMS